MWRSIVQGTIVSNCQGHMQQHTRKNELMLFHGNSVRLYILCVYFDVVYTVCVCVCLCVCMCIYIYILCIEPRQYVSAARYELSLCVCASVLCGSENKERLFLYTALTGWFYNRFNPLQPSGHYMYYRLSIQQLLRSAHTVYLCVLCGSQNKQRLFPHTTLTDWFL